MNATKDDPCKICGAARWQCEYRTVHLFDKESRRKCASEMAEKEVE